jgi:hypothetical protein
MSRNHYREWLKSELKITNTKVRKWLKWIPEGDNGYQAFIESRQVNIPIPECEWSFMVGLHEIGHVSTGYRVHSYLMEYNAEQWAIKRAKQTYNIESAEYIQDAKDYVKDHLLENLLFSDLKIDKVKPYVLEWIGETKLSMSQQIIQMHNDGQIESGSFEPVDINFWSSVAY